MTALQPRQLAPDALRSSLVTWMLGLTIVSIMLLASLPGGNLANYAITAGFLGAVGYAALLGARPLWMSVEWLMLLVWMMYSVLPSLLALDVERAMFKEITMLQIAVLVFAVQQAVVWQRNCAPLLLVYGVSVTISYLITFTGFDLAGATGADLNGDGTARVASTLADANAFGAATVMGLALCFVAAAFNTRPRLQMLLWIFGLLLVVALINSGSRTAVLGLVMLLLGASWAFRVWRMAYFMRLMIGLMVLGVVGGAVFYVIKDLPAVQERIEALLTGNDSILVRMQDFIAVVSSGFDTTAESSGQSLGERMHLVTAAYDLLMQSSLLGVGLDNFAAHVGVFAHSNVMEMLANTGVFGFIAYYAIYIVIAVRAFSLMRSTNGHAVPRTVLAGLAAYSLMDITHVSYYAKASWLYLGLLTACLEVFQRDLDWRRLRVAAAARPLEAEDEEGGESPPLTPAPPRTGRAFAPARSRA